MPGLRLLALAAAAGFAASGAVAQTLPSGVHNVPPDRVVRGTTIDSNTTLNVHDAGFVGSDVDAGVIGGTSTNVTVNVLGGIVGDGLEAFAGSTVNLHDGAIGAELSAFYGSVVSIEGGSVGNNFDAYFGSHITVRGGVVGTVTADNGSHWELYGGAFGGYSVYGGVLERGFEARGGSTVNVRGGAFGDEFKATAGSSVAFHGGEFFLNGVAYNDSTVSLGPSDEFVGVFESGTPFHFSGADGDILSGVALVQAGLPAVGSEPIVVSEPSAGVVTGLRAGQALVVEEGGSLGPFFLAIDSDIHVLGGEVGASFEARGASVRISGGSVGEDFRAYHGSTIDIDGGVVRSRFNAFPGSRVVVHGGRVEGRVEVHEGSAMDVAGGEVGYVDAFSGSVIRVSGGIATVYAHGGSDVSMSEGRLRQLIAQAGSAVNVNGGVVGGNSRVEAMGVVNVASGLVEGGVTVEEGGELNVYGGGVGDHLTAEDDSVVRVYGGSVGDDFSVGSRSVLEVAGGSVGDRLRVAGGTSVTMSSGAIGDRMVISGSGGTVNIYGGRVGALAYLGQGSTMTFSAGSLGDNFVLYGEAVVSGGTLEGSVQAFEGGLLSLSGSGFMLEGVPLDLSPGIPGVIAERDGGSLSGSLADGSPFSLNLNPAFASGQDFFHPSSTLTITLVPDPGDYNGDGQVDATDYGVYQSMYGSEVVPYSYADGNGDGRVDAADYTVWRDHVAPAIAASVPEPAGALLAMLAIVLMASPERERRD